MKLLDAKTSGDLLRLLVFIVVTTLATSLLVVMVGNLTYCRILSGLALLCIALFVYPNVERYSRAMAEQGTK